MPAVTSQLKYSRRELEAMPLSRLRGLDIKTPEDEAIVQEIINDKIEDAPGEGNVFRGDVPDIKTPEEEAEWQAKIDARKARKKGRATTTKLPQAQKKTEAKKEEKKPEMVPYTLTQDDLERLPDLVAKGAKVGDVIQVPKDSVPAAPKRTTNSKKNGSKVLVQKTKGTFCNFCDSKKGFHKAGCPEKKSD